MRSFARRTATSPDSSGRLGRAFGVVTRRFCPAAAAPLHGGSRVELAAERAARRQRGVDGLVAAYATRSWADRLVARVEGAPIPEALVYVPAAILLTLVLDGAQWVTGAVSVGTVRPLHIVLASMIPGLLWLIAISNRAAV